MKEYWYVPGFLSHIEADNAGLPRVCVAETNSWRLGLPHLTFRGCRLWRFLLASCAEPLIGGSSSAYFGAFTRPR